MLFAELPIEMLDTNNRKNNRGFADNPIHARSGSCVSARQAYKFATTFAVKKVVILAFRFSSDLTEFATENK